MAKNQTDATRELIELKNELEQARTQLERERGALDALHKRLKTEFGCASVDAAKRKLTQLVEAAEKSNAKLSKDIAALRKEFDI